MKKICLIVFVSLIFSLSIHAKSKKEKTIVKVDGSSTVYLITEAVAEKFQESKKGSIHVTVGISGTGGGFEKFCKGEIDIADASRPIEQKEINSCKDKKITYVELPIGYDALTVVVNPKNTWVNSMTVAELKKLWEPTPEGQTPITQWNQINPTWPKTKISLYGPGAKSGTFDYFTKAIVGKEKSSRADYMPSEDDNTTVTGVAGDENALGYFGFAYYSENMDKLKAIAIDSGKGTVIPSQEAVEHGTYQPLSRPLFIYVNTQSLKKKHVKEFAEFYVNNAQTLVADVKYVPFQKAEYDMVKARLMGMQQGTVFAGKAEAGLKIKEILQRKPKI